MTNLDDILGPLTEIKASGINVDNDRIGHGLRLHVNTHDEDGQRRRFEVEVPAALIPSLMREIVNYGGSVLAEIADAWRRGDCATCNNIRMINEPRPNGSTWQVHCPDCSADPTDALVGYPVPHRDGQPSRQGGEQ